MKSKKRSKKGSSKSTYKMAKLALKLATKTDKHVDIETFYPGPTGMTGVTAIDSPVSQWRLLNPCAQGTAYNQRIADNIYMKSIKGRLYIENASFSIGATVLTRVMIVYQKFTFGSPPTIPQLFENGSSPVFANNYNPDYMGTQFIVLADKTFQVTSTKPIATVKFGMKLKSGKMSRLARINKVTKYGTTAGTAAAIATGGLWLVAFVDATNESGPTTLTGRLRLTYND